MAEISTYSAPPSGSPGMFSSGYPGINTGYSQALGLLSDPRAVQLQREQMGRLFDPSNIYEQSRRRQAARDQSGVVSGLTQFGAPGYDPQTAQELTGLARERFSATRQLDADEFNRKKLQAQLHTKRVELMERRRAGAETRDLRREMARLQREENALNRAARVKEANLARQARTAEQKWDAERQFLMRHGETMTGRMMRLRGQQQAGPPQSRYTFTSARHGKAPDMESYLRAIGAMR